VFACAIIGSRGDAGAKSFGLDLGRRRSPARAAPAPLAAKLLHSRNEIPPFHSITSSAMASRFGGCAITIQTTLTGMDVRVLSICACQGAPSCVIAGAYAMV
jgi:hypothetical protein